MKMSYKETLDLLNLVLSAEPRLAEAEMLLRLKAMGRTRPEFLSGVIEHADHLPLSSYQWFDIHTKIPNWLLRMEEKLTNKLSPRQIERLPPVGKK